MAGIVDEIKALGKFWHDDGAVADDVLDALDRYALSHGRLAHSVETGTGRSTLLLSHRSDDHRVFALDDTRAKGTQGGNTLARVLGSPLLNQSTTTFVTGPTQSTILGYEFAGPIDLAFIDGPHAYPFPELEYWAIYPHIRPGGMLVIDDIHIPTLGNMFEVLRVDRMWDLDAVVRHTAFLRRSDQPAVDPFGEGFRDQEYNSGRLRWAHLTPRDQAVERLKRAIPTAWKTAVKHRLGRPTKDRPA